MDYDHLLNGRGSRQHHQNMIKEAQRNKLAKDDPGKNKLVNNRR